MAATLLTVMLVITHICEGALLRKSTASDFLQKIRAKRTSECFPGGCSTEDSEARELMEVDEESSSLLYNVGPPQTGIIYGPGREAVVDEGSGM
ncbi:hypothetical protein EPR50_G00041660 [Scomber scombrus]|uniref:Uncharacterized protein n=1 Tax=Scomber scombrus TaxID=13677 RepID=A0AAV1N8U3_SCOSC